MLGSRASLVDMGTEARHRLARNTLGRLARARMDNDVFRREAAEVLRHACPLGPRRGPRPNGPGPPAGRRRPLGAGPRCTAHRPARRRRLRHHRPDRTRSRAHSRAHARLESHRPRARRRRPHHRGPLHPRTSPPPCTYPRTPCATTPRTSSARSAFTTAATSPPPSPANPARQQRKTTSPRTRRRPNLPTTPMVLVSRAAGRKATRWPNLSTHRINS
jgi:hypothetical protein